MSWSASSASVFCTALVLALSLSAVSAGAVTPVLEHPSIPQPVTDDSGRSVFLEPVQNVTVAGIGVLVPSQQFSFSDDDRPGWDKVTLNSGSITATEWAGVVVYRERVVWPTVDPNLWGAFRSNGAIDWMSLYPATMTRHSGSPIEQFNHEGKQTDRTLLYLMYGARGSDNRYRVRWKVVNALAGGQTVQTVNYGNYDSATPYSITCNALYGNLYGYFSSSKVMSTTQYRNPSVLGFTGGGWTTNAFAINAVEQAINATSTPFVETDPNSGSTSAGGLEVPSSLTAFFDDIQSRLSVFSTFFTDLFWPLTSIAENV